MLIRRTTSPRPVRIVAFIGATGRNLIMLRGPLMQALKARGVTVFAMAPSFGSDEEATLESLGIQRATFDMQPRGPRFAADWQIVRALKDKLVALQPDAVVASSGRVLVLALAAAAKARVPRRIALVNALPAATSAAADPLGASERQIAGGLKHATAVVFHNRDHHKTMLGLKAISPAVPVTVLPGAGVDLAAFSPQTLPALSPGLTFLMISTLDSARGVLDYCAAATALKARAPHARFLLAGPSGDGPTGLKPEAVRPYAEAVTFLGPLTDVRPVVGDCHVVVYPSHAEGMPRVVLEALAMGRPVITTSSPGCRDTVDDRVNGCLVAPGDVAGLEIAMASFLKRPDLLPSMSRASRLKAERHFGEGDVLRKWLAVLDLESRAVSSGSAASRAETAAKSDVEAAPVSSAA